MIECEHGRDKLMCNTCHFEPEFPQGKENYCPKCYFNSEQVNLREKCPHNKDIKQTAYEELIKIAEFIKRCAEALQDIKVIDMPIDFENETRKLSRDQIYKAGQLNILMRFNAKLAIEALKLNSEDIKKYSKILANK